MIFFSYITVSFKQEEKMSFVQAKCTNCGGILDVDNTKDAAICKYCGTPFIIEKAINNYNTTNNITANTVNIYGNLTSDFEISGGVLLKYTGTSLTPIIPDSVVAIGDKAFYKTRITEVTIPDSVLEIFASTDLYIGAFYMCENLHTVRMSKNIRDIGSDSFLGCLSLERIVFPDSLQTIGNKAFHHCRNLTEIILPKNLEFISTNAFFDCSKLEKVLFRNDDGEIYDPLEDYQNLISTPVLQNWKNISESFIATPFYTKYWYLRCTTENYCLKCGRPLHKSIFSGKLSCPNRCKS